MVEESTTIRGRSTLERCIFNDVNATMLVTVVFS